MSSSDSPKKPLAADLESGPAPSPLGPTDYQSVPWFRKSGVCSAIIVAHLIVGFLGGCIPLVSLLGIITTLGDLSNIQGQALLQEAGVWSFFGPNGFVSEHDVGGVAKPHPLIFQFAAQQVRVPISHCLFVGENLLEVIGAQVAGMRGLLKPVPPGRELG